MSGAYSDPSKDVVRQGQLTLSPVARRLQLKGHEMLSTGELTLVEAGTYSTCPEPIQLFTDRLLRSRDVGIPLVEVTLVGLDAGYERLNREFGINGRTISRVLHASGIEQINHSDGVTKLEHEAVGLSMYAPEVMLQLSGEELKIATFAEFGTFEGYDGGLIDRWGQPKGPIGSASYDQEDGTIVSLADALPMCLVLKQAEIDFARALRAESSISGTAEDIVDHAQLGRGVADYLGA